MTDYEAAVEIREAVVAVAEQLEGLNVIAERVDTLNATCTRIAAALEQLVRQHHAASQAAHSIAYRHALREIEPA
jgi:hypothetical protein